MSVKLKTASNGSVTLSPQDTASDVVVTVPNVTAELLNNSSGVLNIGSGQVYKDASGNVGIGTDAPATKLHVASTGSQELRLTTNTSGDIRLGFDVSGASYNWIDAYRASGALAFATANTERMRIDFSGNVGIADTSAGARLRVRQENPTGYANAQIEMVSSFGNVLLGFHAAGASAVNIRHVRGAGETLDFVNGLVTAHIPISAAAFNVVSDYRLKENVVPITDALTRVMALKPCRFNFIEGSMAYRSGETIDGFIAHEVAPVVPEAVTGEKDALMENGDIRAQALDQAKLVPLLTAAIQELTARLEALEAK